MRIVAVDNETLALNSLVRALVNTHGQRRTENDTQNDAQVQGFQFCTRALEHIAMEREQGQGVDYVFTDMNMPDISGIEFAKKVKECSPQTTVFFVTADINSIGCRSKISEFGYVLKPFSGESLNTTIREFEQNGRQNLPYAAHAVLWVQTFGTVEVFAKGKPVLFGHGEEKELFAYLINLRREQIAMNEIAAFFSLPGRSPKIARKIARQRLAGVCKALYRAGADKVFIRRWRNVQIDWQQIESDAGLFALGDVRAVNSYQGSYMAEYDWAEWKLGDWTVAKS